MRNRVADTERLIKVIIYVRKSAGLSQMDLAKALGKSVGTIKTGRMVLAHQTSRHC